MTTSGTGIKLREKIIINYYFTYVYNILYNVLYTDIPFNDISIYFNESILCIMILLIRYVFIYNL